MTTRPAALVASATIGAGQVGFGGVVSRTVTVKVQALVFPLPSVAVTVTVVTPIGKVEPEAGFEMSEATEQLSEAEGVKLTKAPAGPVASATRGPGQVMDGTVVSRKFTVAWQLAVKPLTLVTVKVTTVAPSPRKVPGAGLWLMLWGPQPETTISPRRSAKALVQLPSAKKVRLVAQVTMTGALVVLTVTLTVPTAVPPT